MELEQAIKECPWRKDMAGVDICAGECLPCSRIIETGKCDTLIQLFKSKNDCEVKNNGLFHLRE